MGEEIKKTDGETSYFTAVNFSTISISSATEQHALKMRIIWLWSFLYQIQSGQRIQKRHLKIIFPKTGIQNSALYFNIEWILYKESKNIHITLQASKAAMCCCLLLSRDFTLLNRIIQPHTRITITWGLGTLFT